MYQEIWIATSVLCELLYGTELNIKFILRRSFQLDIFLVLLLEYITPLFLIILYSIECDVK